MSQSSVDGFGRTEFDLEPVKLNPEVTEDIQQTLSRLLLWDRINRRWIAPSANPDGQMNVTFAGVAINNIRYGTIIVPAATGMLFAANNYRRQLIIEVYSTEIYIGFSAATALGNSIRLSAGSVFSIDNYIGEVWGLTGTVPASNAYIEV